MIDMLILFVMVVDIDCVGCWLLLELIVVVMVVVVMVVVVGIIAMSKGFGKRKNGSCG